MDLLWSNTADAITSPNPMIVRTKAITSRAIVPHFSSYSFICSAKGDISLNFICFYLFHFTVTFPLPVRIVTIQKKSLVFPYLCGSRHEPRQQPQQSSKPQWRHQMLNKSVYHGCYTNLDHIHLRKIKNKKIKALTCCFYHCGAWTFQLHHHFCTKTSYYCEENMYSSYCAW